MKKFLGNFLILISILLISLAAVPWNDLGQWYIPVTVSATYEMYIKGGIGVLAILIGIVYLVLANSEYRNNGFVSRNTARAAFIPLYTFIIAITVFGGLINYYIYAQASNTTNLLIVGFFGLIALNLIIFAHVFGTHFKEESNGKRIAHFILLVEMAAVMGYLTYWFFNYKLTNYSAFSTFYLVGVAALSILLYVVHLIISSLHSKKNEEIEELEEEIEEIREGSSAQPKKQPQSQSKNVKREQGKKTIATKDGHKTMIVSNQQTIVSSEANIDPTNMIYEDVHVDPEFSKTTAPANQANSIEYYIEKPKMFKPLEPTFDDLVQSIREMPNVVTKLDDDRITFYVDRKPFLVLMNFGNYYRMAFKYDLEKGIRLIIKYPTISKNKSTRDELWFKANNYGDIPKDVIYQIIKYSYNNVNA
ncbi:MAG: hypothetical protein JXB08_04190 [Bacilli bacterium]|nr:hypothetical protein [Bacilli bacterium]MBN2877130.1 hypothetical protein [Bacilli bacterium]